MSIRKRVSALAAMAAALAVAGPVAAAGAQSPVTLPSLPGVSLPGVTGSGADLCIHGIPDLGPFGPMGPYGPSGPYGANGPLHNQANPLGNAATCGGLLTYILRGGDLTSFVNASITPPAK